MRDGFLKVAAASPQMRVADCAYNTEQMEKAIAAAAQRGVSLLVLPELCLTSYSCEDLFWQPALLEAAQEGVLRLAQATKDREIVVAAGLPLTVNGRLYNAAAVLANGRILGVVPKRHLPNYTEFYEGRHFAPGPREVTSVELGGAAVPFGTRQLFRCSELPAFVLGVQIY